MKLLGLCCIVFCVTSLSLANMDVRAPVPTPESIKPGKVVLHTSLTVIPDAKANEARLQISQATLNELRAEIGGTSNAPVAAIVGQSRTRTILAGLLMFFAVSIAGVLIARKARSLGRAEKAAVALVFFAGVLGATAMITRGNAGPPGSYRWRNLPAALMEGKSTAGGVDVEVVPDNEMDGVKFRLIVPIKSQRIAE
jgi:hypothetical protein